MAIYQGTGIDNRELSEIRLSRRSPLPSASPLPAAVSKLELTAQNEMGHRAPEMIGRSASQIGSRLLDRLTCVALFIYGTSSITGADVMPAPVTVNKYLPEGMPAGSVKFTVCGAVPPPTATELQLLVRA